MARSLVWKRYTGSYVGSGGDLSGMLLNYDSFPQGATIVRTHLQLWAYGYSPTLVPVASWTPHIIGMRLFPSSFDPIATGGVGPLTLPDEDWLIYVYPWYDLTTIPYGGGARYRMLNSYADHDVKSQRLVADAEGDDMWLLWEKQAGSSWQLQINFAVSFLVLMPGV